MLVLHPINSDILILFCFVVTITSCSFSSSSHEDKKHNKNKSELVIEGNEKDSLGIGLIVLNPDSVKGASFTLYNEDKTPWLDVKLGLQLPKEFVPMAYHYDYNLLVLKCNKIRGKHYEVAVSDETNTSKLLSIHSPGFTFLNWNEYLLEYVFAVGFNYREVFVYESNDLNSDVVSFNKNTPDCCIFHPVTIEDNWLKIKWRQAYFGEKEGWIQWRDKNGILIDLYYF